MNPLRQFPFGGAPENAGAMPEISGADRELTPVVALDLLHVLDQAAHNVALAPSDIQPQQEQSHGQRAA